jgi:hypothetical protein
MDPVFAATENLGLSIWLRESPSLWGFPFVLILHTVGLAFLVGSSVAVNVRVLGMARAVPFAPLGRYFTVMWFGFWVNLVSGLLLLLAYPTKALTNPLFYVKLAFIATALTLVRRIRAHLRSRSSGPAPGEPDAAARRLAWACLSCWVISIAAGRFLAYTHTRLMVDLMAWGK